MSEDIHTKAYPIAYEERIELGWFEGSKKNTYRIPVVWNERYTDVLNAQTDFIVKPDETVMGARLYMSSSRISELLWVFGESPELKSDTRDVTGRLRNGENIFEIECFKSSAIHFPPVGFTVSANIVVTYKGDEPGVKPWEEYIVPAVAGVGTFIFGWWLLKR